ncbi:hypothetical protein ACFYWU_41105 [Streptomyces chrestomyceticus]|uniref:hypothetical protein n=1 Tax=Streptomyces chrestomyceticus TaxID=68185 RepID=UPI0036B9846B
MIYVCEPGADALAKSLLARLECHARLHLRLDSQTFRDHTEPEVDCNRRPRWRDEVKTMLGNDQTRPGHLVVPSMNHIALTCGTQREIYRWVHGLGVMVHCTDPPFFSVQDFLGDALNVLVRLEEVYRLTRRLRHAQAEIVLTACGDLRKLLGDALPLARQRLRTVDSARLHATVQEGERLLAPHTHLRPREELHRLIHCLRRLLPPELTGPWNDPWSPVLPARMTPAPP